MNSVTGALSIDDLLLAKALSPLGPDAIAILTRVQDLDIANFNEAEVRAYVIDPIVQVLGYAKGTDFSVYLERPIAFQGSSKRPDYRFTLWEEDFWLIEAKRPKPGEDTFGYADLAQAFEYACHPEINAALLVLCNGDRIEIFDREQSVVEPVLRLRREQLVAEFDKLRLLLEPWQVWFFQKRRVARLIERVFSKEFNLNRVDEFRRLVNGRLEGLRDTILDNYRAAPMDDRTQERWIATAPLEELVDVTFFFDHSYPATKQIIQRLVDLSVPNGFWVMNRMLPDQPRDVNHTFFAHAAIYLMALAKRTETAGWLPAWLTQGAQRNASVGDVTKVIVRQCLTFFEGDPDRRIILLAAAALKRLLKLLLLIDDASWATARLMHSAYRYFGDERDWRQFAASPSGQAIGLLNTRTIMATRRFVAECRGDHSEFQAETARMRLKSLWQVEAALLQSMPNWAKLERERALGDLTPTEATCVTHDALGHGLLCRLTPFPEWRSYIEEHHRAELETLAATGAWSARELLGMSLEDRTSIDDQMLADRFFFGDTNMLETLRAGYAARL